MSAPVAYIGVILIWSAMPLAIRWSSDGVGLVILGGLLIYQYGGNARRGYAIRCLIARWSRAGGVEVLDATGD